MNPLLTTLTALFNKIPRRHSIETVKDMNHIMEEYEELLIKIEGMNAVYEKKIPVFFEDLDEVRGAIKRSTDNKLSKKSKDVFFDEGSGKLKDSIQALIGICEDGGNN